MVRPNEPIAAVMKAAMATAIIAPEMLLMLVFIEFLTKRVDMTAVYASNKNISKLESHTQSEWNHDDNPTKTITRTRRSPRNCDSQS